MISGLQELVNGQQIASWLIIAFLVLYFIYKEAPDFKKRISKTAVKEKQDEISGKTLEERLTNMEKTMNEINEKLCRDYERLNALEREHNVTKKAVKESITEQEIMLRGLLAVMDGLQELGVNGATQKSAQEINDYLNRKAHDTDRMEA